MTLLTWAAWAFLLGTEAAVLGFLLWLWRKAA